MDEFSGGDIQNGQLRIYNAQALPGYITEAEIAEIIYKFLALHGYPLKTNFRYLLLDIAEEESVSKISRFNSNFLNTVATIIFRCIPVSGEFYRGHKRGISKIKLYLPYLRNRKKFIKVLVHELDHALWFLQRRGTEPRKYEAIYEEKRARIKEFLWYKKAERIAGGARRENNGSKK